MEILLLIVILVLVAGDAFFIFVGDILKAFVITVAGLMVIVASGGAPFLDFINKALPYIPVAILMLISPILVVDWLKDRKEAAKYLPLVAGQKLTSEQREYLSKKLNNLSNHEEGSEFAKLFTQLCYNGLIIKILTRENLTEKEVEFINLKFAPRVSKKVTEGPRPE